MTFEQATKFKQIDWTQPEHEEDRNSWAAGRNKLPRPSKLDMEELEAVIRDFDKGIKKGEQVGPRVRQFFALMDKVGRDSPLIWEYYKKHFRPNMIYKES